jgi:hypothetical protein
MVPANATLPPEQILAGYKACRLYSAGVGLATQPPCTLLLPLAPPLWKAKSRASSQLGLPADPREAWTKSTYPADS